MKKILFISDNIDVGGVEKVLINLFKYLTTNDVEITLLLLNGNGVWEKNIPDYIKVRTIFNKKLPYNLEKFFKYLIMILPGKLIKKLIIQETFDYNIAFKENMIFFLKGTKGRTICWIHGDHSAQRNKYIYDKLDNDKRLRVKLSNKKTLEMYNKIDKIICVSETAKQAFVEKYGVVDSKVECKYNVNDVEEILALSNEGSLEKSNDVFCFITCGRLVSVKGYQRLLSICNRLIKEGFIFSLLIIGDGPEYDNYKSYIENNNMQNIVKLIGHDNNPYKYMKISDMYICSSYTEAYSTSATEALILGKPVLTTLCSGFEEMLEGGLFGMIVENTDEDLYEGMKKVLNNNELVDNYRVNIEVNKTKWSTSKTVQEITKLFNL